MRRWRCVPALLALLLLLSACGGGAEAEPEVLRQAMTDAAPSLPEMLRADDTDENAEELFAHISDMDYGKVSRFFVLYAADGSADEIAAILVKNRADAEDARRSLASHLEDRARLYEQYKPEQLRRIEQAELFVRGRWAVLIVCDGAEAVKAACIRAMG